MDKQHFERLVEGVREMKRHMAGLVARRHNAALKTFGDRLSKNGLAPKAVIGAVMRKLAHFIYGVIKSGKPFDLKRAMPQLDFQDGI